MAIKYLTVPNHCADYTMSGPLESLISFRQILKEISSW